jgi:hypothetical protein
MPYKTKPYQTKPNNVKKAITESFLKLEAPKSAR